MKTYLGILLFILSSCGKKLSQEQNDLFMRDYENEEKNQIYRGILRPLNNQLSGFLPSGLVEVIINNDSLEIKTLLDDDAKVTHIQSIHQGSRCPDISDDKNADGLIDINEAIRVSGEVYIPLDGDLNSEKLGQGIYPKGSGYTYREKASLKKMAQDLGSRNLNLDWPNRAVIILGTLKRNDLPLTIETNGIFPVEKSLPIACGVLRKLEWVRPTRWQAR